MPRADPAGEIRLARDHVAPLGVDRSQELLAARLGVDVGRAREQVQRPHGVAADGHRVVEGNIVLEVRGAEAAPAERGASPPPDQLGGELEEAAVAVCPVQLDERGLDLGMPGNVVPREARRRASTRSGLRSPRGRRSRHACACRRPRPGSGGPRSRARGPSRDRRTGDPARRPGCRSSRSRPVPGPPRSARRSRRENAPARDRGRALAPSRSPRAPCRGPNRETAAAGSRRSSFLPRCGSSRSCRSPRASSSRRGSSPPGCGAAARPRIHRGSRQSRRGSAGGRAAAARPGRPGRPSPALLIVVAVPGRPAPTSTGGAGPVDSRMTSSPPTRS